jgi:hypothetical protein
MAKKAKERSSMSVLLLRRAARAEKYRRQADRLEAKAKALRERANVCEPPAAAPQPEKPAKD